MPFRSIGLWLMLALIPGLAVGDDDDGPVSALDLSLVADASPRQIERPQDALAEVAEDTQNVATAAAQEPADSDFWVGLDCDAPDETLRAHLGLAAPQGLVIREVFDSSPAAAAGLKVHDVITAVQLAGAVHQITGTPQLAELIQTSNGQPITVVVLRGGKSHEISVSPVTRPGIELARHEAGPPQRLSPGQGRAAGGFPGRRPGPGFGRGPRSRFGGPMWAQLGDERGQLPDDMRITISKSGNQPADITITQGDKSWTVKGDDVKSLPPEVRGSLAKFLGLGLMTKLRDAFAEGMPPAASSGQRLHRGPGAAQHEPGKQDRRAHRGRQRHRQHARHRGHGRHEGGGPHRAGHASWHGEHDCPICLAQQRHAQGPRPDMGHPHHPAMSRPGANHAGGKLEMLIGRLERVLAAHGHGPIGGGPAFGPGFGGPVARPGQPPWAGRERPAAPHPVPPEARRRQLDEVVEKRHDVHSPLNDLRDQLRRMQEQQERMARALRDLSEAMERLQRK